MTHSLAGTIGLFGVAVARFDGSHQAQGSKCEGRQRVPQPLGASSVEAFPGCPQQLKVLIRV